MFENKQCVGISLFEILSNTVYSTIIIFCILFVLHTGERTGSDGVCFDSCALPPLHRRLPRATTGFRLGLGLGLRVSFCVFLGFASDRSFTACPRNYKVTPAALGLTAGGPGWPA